MYLSKAYNSIPHEALQITLRKLGVPDALVEIIKFFHNNIKVTVRLDGELLDKIEVNNGQHQGCTMAPTLLTSMLV